MVAFGRNGLEDHPKMTLENQRVSISGLSMLGSVAHKTEISHDLFHMWTP